MHPDFFAIYTRFTSLDWLTFFDALRFSFPASPRSLLHLCHIHVLL